MKLVIEMPDEDYDFTKGAKTARTYNTEYYVNLILKGTPLPKGHGDLIDKDECLKMKMTDLYDKDGVTMYAIPTGNILRMKPVIEADKENEE